MEIILHSHANKTHFHKKARKWGFLELGSGLLGISPAPEIEPTTSRSAVKRSPTELLLACENIRFSLLFVDGDVSRGGNVPDGKERGETEVFAG